MAQDEEEQSDSSDDAGAHKITYTPYKIEFGLTHGTVQIHSMFATKFATIPHNDRKDGSRIFEFCERLKFEQVSASLIKFLRTPTRGTAMLLSCDLHDSSEIMRIIRKNRRFNAEYQTHEAFSQMRLFTTIDAEVQNGNYSSYQARIDELAKNEVGSEVSRAFTETVNEIRTEYHRGRKWLEISQSFGGTGMIFIIIAIGMLEPLQFLPC